MSPENDNLKPTEKLTFSWRMVIFLEVMSAMIAASSLMIGVVVGGRALKRKHRSAYWPFALR